MLFKLTDECFAHSVNSSDLLGLSQAVLRGCHGITVVDESAPHYSAWFSRQTLESREEWELAISETARRQAMGPSTLKADIVHGAVSNFETSTFLVSPQDANRFARSPFRIFVENDHADKNFLLAFSDSFQAAELNMLEAEGFIIFEHCGGITHFPSRIKTHAGMNGRFKVMAAAVYDSDSLMPGVNSDQAKLVARSCTGVGIPGFCLIRRSIENYLPLWALTSWANTEAKTHVDRSKLVKAKDALARQSPAQRHHYNMKSGLDGDGPRLSNALWGGLDAASRSSLKSGFGQNVASLFAEDWVKDTLSQADSGWGEINGVIVSILGLVR